MSDKITLPRVTMLQDGMGNPRYTMDSKDYAQHETFKLAENWPLNEGWELRQHGVAMTLVYERDLTITIIMGSWDWNSKAYALASSAGDGEVAATEDTFLWDDVPEHMQQGLTEGNGATPEIIEQFYNHLIFEALESYLPMERLDTSSHIQV